MVGVRMTFAGVGVGVVVPEDRAVARANDARVVAVPIGANEAGFDLWFLVNVDEEAVATFQPPEHREVTFIFSVDILEGAR